MSSTQVSLPATAIVESDGAILVDGQHFTSPSAAGSHVRDGKATNGWSFWAVERDGTSVPLATIRAHLRRRET